MDSIGTQKYEIVFMLYKYTPPDLTLKSAWYKDITPITYLSIHECNINAIEANAFFLPAFQNLRTITFIINKPIEIKVGTFNGIPLSYIYINVIERSLLNLQYNFLNSVSQTLMKLTLVHLNSRTNIFNIIGGVSLAKLNSLSFQYCYELLRVITPTTITKVPLMKCLAINKCDVEIIEEGSFDHLVNLEIINLRFNRLRTLPFGLFENSPILLGDPMFYGNPLECTCIFIDLQRKFPGCFHFVCNAEIEKPNCTFPITSERSNSHKCSSQYGTNSLRVNFSINLRLKYVTTNEYEYIFVKCSKRIKFYLLIMNENNFAPHCILATAKYAAFYLANEYGNSGVYTVCGLDVQSTQMIWPKNCASFNRISFDINWIDVKWKNWIIFNGIVAICSTFLASCCIGIYLVRRKLILLSGVDRVFIDRDQGSHKIETVVVLPRNWKDSKKLTAIKSMRNGVTENYEIYKEKGAIPTQNYECVRWNKFHFITDSR